MVLLDVVILSIYHVCWLMQADYNQLHNYYYYTLISVKIIATVATMTILNYCIVEKRTRQSP